MSSLLTREEYQSLASSLNLPNGAVIGGKSRASTSRGTFETFNPATGKLLAKIAACEKVDVDLAVEKAREAFDSGVWSKMHPASRKKILIEFVKLLRRNAHELAVLESIESGKPIYDVETIDLPEAFNCLEWYAETADKVYDQVAPAGSDAMALVVREPIGVVACVLPWNFPLLMLAWKIGPALAAGNCVIAKPAELTTMSTIRVAELAHESGVPSGVFQVVTGTGEVAGREIGMHPGIDMVTFTGSTEIGRKFLEYSARSNLKKIVLECGGKNPCIVMDDAENLEVVAAHVVQAAFWNMGENCSANSRLILHKSGKDRLLELITQRLRSWPVGDPLDPANRLGAIVSKEHYEKICSYIDRGKAEGAKIVLGGKPMPNGSGCFVEPTIFTGVKPSMSIARDEIFGPVLSVIEIGSSEEAVSVANDTEYGLAASIFSAHGSRAQRMARAIKAGTVSVNCYSEGDITTPFGGYKLSGFGGRDKSLHALDQYTQLKTIWTDISELTQ